jgi:hypothetical protein
VNRIATGAHQGAPLSPATRAREIERPVRAALILIVFFGLARLALDLSLGLGADEAYTVAVSRRLALSYFDHPPLHQWLAHFSALVFGEGVWVRLPFIVLFGGTGWLLFALTRALFGTGAALWALFGLNASPFFFASAGGWVVPDGCLLFALAAAALVLAKACFGAPDAGAAWRLWLAAGFWLGLAGLSKYSATFAPLGIAIFLALAPRQRHWFAHPAPYAAALLALAMVTPVLIWNYDNGWVSFAFQSARGAPSDRLRLDQVGAMLAGQIALLTPWILAPLLGGLIAAVRRRDDERQLFLLCLAAPPIVFFTLAPLWSARGLPHWPMPGWFFAFPLAGAWVSAGWARRFDMRPFAFGACALLAALALVVVTHADTGWIKRLIALPAGVVDPTLETLDWSALRKTPLFAAARPAFAVSVKWSDAGKIAVALGPEVPVLIFSDDPRGMAFADNSANYLGRDGVIVAPSGKLDFVAGALRPYFADLGQPEHMAVQRGGRDEIALVLIPAHGLTRPFALPYPRAAGGAS